MSLPALAQASFTDVAASAGVDDDGLSVSAAWGDYDGDGDLDLYIIDGRGTANPQGRRILYRNEGDGTFTDVAPDAGVGIDGGNGASALWGDYDSDGDLDLYVFCSANVAADAVNRLFRNDGDGTFSEIAASAGVADEDYSPGGSWVDHDNDGDLDLHVVSGYQVSGPRTA
ncbi:MAG: VCBS repeat-containing protein, partial [Gemmatimonadetes bacterium]|nr:VCBS repeat-containing protein [Gemmatimonadota bacterium]